jgi:proteasome assembly chaperone (PAC2) family protein
MENGVWIQRYGAIELYEPVAVVGSPGLRSIGKLAVEKLITETKAKLVAELYSPHFPSIYETNPSYAADPALPGIGGVIVESQGADLPKVQFFACSSPPLILVKGYHANFQGQYDVAEKIAAFLSKMHVKRIIVVAGYGSKEKKVCCAATSPELIRELKEKYEIGVDYKGPFMGFSGLVFGASKQKGIEALCLFSAAEPAEENLEFPAPDAAERALVKLRAILGLHK